MKVIGLDLSINSTGICVKDDNKYVYFIVLPKLTKKQMSLNHPDLKYLVYEKVESGETYEEKEYSKSQSIYNIAKQILRVIKAYKPDYAVIEGISYGSGSGHVADLAGLNFIVRSMLLEQKIPFKIVSPMTNKKFAVGNGGAAKDVIVDSFVHCQPQFKNIQVKIDDIADAFFLANNSD